MPRFPLIAISTLCLALASPASGQSANPKVFPIQQEQFPLELEQVSLSAGGMVLIDPASIRRNGPIIDVRTIAIPPELAHAAAFMWSEERIDCRARTLEKFVQTGYDQSLRPLESHAEPAEVIPDNVDAADRIDRVCSGRSDLSMIRRYDTLFDLFHEAWPRIEDKIAEAADAK